MLYYPKTYSQIQTLCCFGMLSTDHMDRSYLTVETDRGDKFLLTSAQTYYQSKFVQCERGYCLM